MLPVLGNSCGAVRIRSVEHSVVGSIPGRLSTWKSRATPRATRLNLEAVASFVGHCQP